MQRSRRAFLQRKALGTATSGRKRLYKVSLSLFIGMWVLVFLLNLWIGHGDSYADGSGIVGESIWHENEAQTIAGSASREKLTSIELDLNDCNKENDEITAGKNNLFVSEENEISLASDPIKQAVENTVTLDRENSERDQRTDRLVRIAPPGLDEFKSKAVSKGKPTAGQGGGITYRVEPDGREYNYASATKGAKILCFNKEAKGASNILEKDKDKYLRNPCSAEEKFVVIELSEETLVDSVEIANFEHYSSNFKDFELLSSLVYPTDNWVKLGNFTAGNAKHAQRFALLEPKWARYLKLNLLSHYGSEFYCTLSILEVYGVDAIERMLEDLISVEENRFVPEETPTKPGPVIEHPVPTDGEDFLRKLLSEIEDVHEPEDPDTRHEVSKNNIPDPITEVRPQQAGRIPGDSVLKILMQKVRSLDLNFSVLERYLEELNARYGDIFKDFDDGIADKDTRLQQISLKIKDLVNAKAVFTKDFEELVSWKSLVSSQLDMLIRDNAILRSEVERVREYQVSMENKGVVLILVSLVFGCLAIAKLFIDALRSLCRFRGECCGEFCTRTYSAAWLLLLLSSVFIVFILLI